MINFIPFYVYNKNNTNMSNQKQYQIVINGIKESISDVDILLKQLDKTMTNDIELELRDIANKLDIPIYLIPNKILYLTKNDVLEILK